MQYAVLKASTSEFVAGYLTKAVEYKLALMLKSSGVFEYEIVVMPFEWEIKLCN